MDKDIRIAAQPYDFSFSPNHTALLVIDMQRDFLLPSGFGACQSTELDAVQATIPHVQKLLSLFRSSGVTVIHTREGHLPDMSDCPSSKLYRNVPCRPQDTSRIGDNGVMGRLLIRGEFGHDIINEVQPLPDELVIDKPGKGAFWNTSLMDELRARSVTHLVVCGVTTECCFTTTIREANDRGFECCGVAEATAGYVSAFKDVSLRMLDFAGGLFGFTASLSAFESAMNAKTSTSSNKAGNGTNGHSTEDLTSSTDNWNGDLTLDALKSYYRFGGSVNTVINAVYDKIERYAKVDSAVWIHIEPRATALKAAATLVAQYSDIRARPTLYGIPFSVKDSLDIANIPTTTACEPLTRHPEANAPVCQKVLDAGAIFIGKVNLDQFATGLSGCRSPYGTTHSVFSSSFISGGSSSGSCVSVGAKLCSFSIATDTAGSGRVPAGFNGVIGFKPTRGTISAGGLVPAAPSLDCIALIAAEVQDARYVWNVVKGFDEDDPYAKWAISRPKPVHSIGPQATSFRFGIPPPEALQVVCLTYQCEFQKACEALCAIGGIQQDDINWSPFQKAGDLLYEGTLVSERLATLPDGWVQKHKDALHPVVSQLLQDVEARQSTAVQAYRDLMAKAQYTRQAETVFRPGAGGIDVLVVPTAPIHWTVDEMQEQPIKRNAFLGTFTHCGNVLDLCAVAAPASTYPASELGERCPEVVESRNYRLVLLFWALVGLMRRFWRLPRGLRKLVDDAVLILVASLHLRIFHGN